MKCEIIRDLLPSYLDGLTSEESNREVEAHLADCCACREAADKMKAGWEEPTPSCDPKKIRPFKKLNRRLFLAVAASFLVCVLLAGGTFFFYGIGWQIDSSEILVETSMQNGILTLDFTLTDGGILHAVNRVESPGATRVIEFRECRPFPLDDRGSEPNRYSWGIHTVDREGNPLPLPQELLILRFRDRSETLSLADLLRQANS